MRFSRALGGILAVVFTLAIAVGPSLGVDNCSDNDGDGYGVGTGCLGPDCDDTDVSINPAAGEVCDGVDNNCDGEVDESGASGEITWYVDADGDGWGDTSAATIVACDPPDGYVATSGDCDDNASSIYPGAVEVVGDEVDQNCDGVETCYADSDNDGHRTIAGTTVGSADCDCDDSGEAPASAPDDDCDDGDGSVYPGAPEIVGDGVDQNCDGQEACYRDADGDGYRTNQTIPSSDFICGNDSGEAPNGASIDCDDTDAAINPAAAEIPGDGVDQDCDGQELCYPDSDNDGYRLAGPTFASSDCDCSDSGEAMAGDPAGDCDDSEAGVNPGATEECNGIDDNCDGNVDEGNPGSGVSCDGADSDQCREGVTSCSGGVVVCSDTTGSTPEVCNGVDDDCDGLVDEGLVLIEPAGEAGSGEMLDQVLPLEEGEDAPMAGMRPLVAIHEFGDIVTGRCLIQCASGRVCRSTFIHLYIYSVDIDGDPETQMLIDHWVVRYDRVAGAHAFTWDTAGLDAGYYDIRLWFASGTAETIRIQLVESTGIAQ